MDALEHLKGAKLRVLAGGTDLIPRLRAQVESPQYLLDLADCGLDRIVVEQGQIRIGALVSFAAICRHRVIQEQLPALYESSVQIGATQCRTLATIGGNLCSAVPSADSAPPLIALDAKLQLRSKSGERLVPAEDFFVSPRRTVLAPEEILTEIVVPLNEDFRASFLRIGRRKALTLAIVNAAAGVRLLDNSVVADARIALGAVAPTPIRARRAEKVLQNELVTKELIAHAADVAVTETSPISDLRASAEYRRKITAVLVRRCLGNAIAQSMRVCR